MVASHLVVILIGAGSSYSLLPQHDNSLLPSGRRAMYASGVSPIDGSRKIKPSRPNFILLTTRFGRSRFTALGYAARYSER